MTSPGRQLLSLSKKGQPRSWGTEGRTLSRRFTRRQECVKPNGVRAASSRVLTMQEG
jgi:hypothetical protein